MHRGYIKIWRKLEDSGLLQMHGTLALFMHILLKATHKPTKIGTPIGVVELDRGQYVSGRHKLASAVGLTEREIRTCLTRLEELDILSIKTTSKYSIYTIVNYGNYQDCDQLNDQQQANNRPTIDQQSTTKQEHKHINTKEETKPTSAKSAISIKTFIQNCEDSGERRIPENDPVFEFAETTGISLDMVKVCWNHFVDTHMQNGKRQKDWRATFRNCVKNNWYKLWFVEADGTVKETSQYRALKKGQPNV